MNGVTIGLLPSLQLIIRLAQDGFSKLRSESIMASDQRPSGWGADTLTGFFELVRQNQFANFRDKKRSAERLIEIDYVFVRVAEGWTEPKDMLEPILFSRCHGAFRAASATALSGQMFETSALVRSCLEHAGYAALMRQEPVLVGIWMNRQQDEAALKATRKAFTQTNVRAAIAAIDSEAASIYEDLYQRCVDFGGHPNIFGIAASTTVEEVGPTKRVVRVVHLHADGPQSHWAISTVIRAGKCGLRIFDSIFPERFKQVGVQLVPEERR